MPGTFFNMLKQVVEFPTYLPAIRNIAGGKNRLYVQTYRKKQDLSEFLVFGEKGKMLKQVYLPDKWRYKIKINPDVTFTIKNGCYYYLVEDLENEQWELHRMAIK